MDINELASIIRSWADETFPDRTDASMFLKIYSEIGEVIESGGDPMEVADLFILLLDFADRREIKLQEAILKKLEINRNRVWVVDPATGTMRHVRGAVHADPRIIDGED